MTNLSKHFTEAEYIESSTARERKIDNSLDDFHRKIAIHTCQYLLEPLRELLNNYFGCPVVMVISSGYRCPKLNAAVGGSSTSEHMKGCAVDFHAYKIKNGIRILINPTDVYNLIKTWVKEGKISVNQCIDEFSGTAHWTHVSHHPSGKSLDKREFLKYTNKQYKLDVFL